jgi:hypothetical protein
MGAETRAFVVAASARRQLDSRAQRRDRGDGASEKLVVDHPQQPRLALAGALRVGAFGSALTVLTFCRRFI